MADGKKKNNDGDFYAVLGLNKECTPTELRTAYKKLALRWHPDRCSASGNPTFVEEANKKFQAIQQAYSVLSDSSKRFMYDVGAYDSDDEDPDDMGDFLKEMATMMNQTKSNDNVEESFKELQDMFEEMIQDDFSPFASTTTNQSMSSSSNSCFTFSYASCDGSSNANNKRNVPEMNSGKISMGSSSTFDGRVHNFSIGVGSQQDFKRGKATGERNRAGASSSWRSRGRKQKAPSTCDNRGIFSS